MTPDIEAGAMPARLTPADDAPSLLRPPGERDHRVTSMELFFDLVYVFAVTQLSHLLLEHLSWHGAAQTLLLLLAVWWAWVYNAWFTNWFDPDRRPVRLVLLGVMLLSLMMAAALPDAFGERGLFFAATYVAAQFGRCLFIVATLEREPALRRSFQRILVWAGAAGALWLLGGLAEGTTRELLWLAAVVVDYAGPAVGYFTPGLGRSLTTDWNIAGGHLAERCQLFLIIALGESILVTGATFGQLPLSAASVAAVTVGLLGSLALWWLYFDRGAGDSGVIMARSKDPGRLGRSAYTYFHVPMVAGIIVAAVGDELMIAHPMEPASAAAAATILGGPALFLAGHALFKWLVFQHFSRPRVAAIAALAALGQIGAFVPALALAAAATLIVAAVAAWDTRLYYLHARLTEA